MKMQISIPIPVIMFHYQSQHLLLEIQRHIMNEAVRFMPVTKVSTWVWWPKVEDFHPNLTFGEYFYLARLSEGSNGIVTN